MAPAFLPSQTLSLLPNSQNGKEGRQEQWGHAVTHTEFVIAIMLITHPPPPTPTHLGYRLVSRTENTTAPSSAPPSLLDLLALLASWRWACHPIFQMVEPNPEKDKRHDLQTLKCLDLSLTDQLGVWRLGEPQSWHLLL